MPSPDAVRPALCVLFLHHKDDALTRLHFDLLRRSNPRAVIVPLCDAPEGRLPGAIDTAALPTPWNTSNKWRSCDTMIYRWFRQRDFDAERYVVLEYDCRCDIDLLQHYRALGDVDVVAASYIEPERHPRWYWFREAERLSDADRAARAGIVPIAGAAFTHDALARVCDVVTTADVFSELRLGTAVRRAGLRVRTFAGADRRHFGWREYRRPIVRPGLYHAVKHVNHNQVQLVRALKQAARRLLTAWQSWRRR
ncbi:MAG: hypothetical protein U1F43_02715 [Myxococcota bacterium]